MGAWIKGGGRGTGDGRGKGGSASPKRVGSGTNKGKLRSNANYFAMKKPRKKGREPGLQGRFEPPPFPYPVPSPPPLHHHHLFIPGKNIGQIYSILKNSYKLLNLFH